MRRLRTGPARPHDVPHALGAALRFPARRDRCHLSSDRQIQDDILDYYGDENLTGKKLGKDFEEGKYTLPVIVALKNANQENRSKLMSLFKTRKPEEFQEVLTILNETNTYEEMQKVFFFYSTICEEELKNIPSNEYREALEDIVINLGTRLT